MRWGLPRPVDVNTCRARPLGRPADGQMQRELVEHARRGDHDAFEALASMAFDGLYALAHRILRDVDRTDDAVQECLIRAWKQLPQLRDPDRFDAWLRRLLVNACYDESRRTGAGRWRSACCPWSAPAGATPRPTWPTATSWSAASGA